MKPSTLQKKCSVIIPFVDQWDFTERCLQKLGLLTTEPTELVLIDNGSDKSFKKQAEKLCLSTNLLLNYVRLEENVGVLKTFQIGLENAEGEVLCFIHNDVLIHEAGWNERVARAFDQDPQLGLAGLFGARGVQPDGGREGSMSHMLGQEWGKTEAQPAALHHGELMTATSPAAVFDGVGLFFRKTVLQDLAEHSDLFADWRAPHHFYDRIMSLKVLERGYHMCVIGIQFDHYSGATANHLQKYADFGRKWLATQGLAVNGIGVDDTIYWLAEGQWRQEFANRLPAFVDQDYNVRWSG